MRAGYGGLGKTHMDDLSTHNEFSRIIYPYFYGMAPMRYRILVDVGVLGYEPSNTFNLVAEHDWGGLYIEAEAENYQRAVLQLKDYPKIKLIHRAIVPEDQYIASVRDNEGKVPLYIHTNVAHHSLKPEWLPDTLSHHVQQVPAARLPVLLNEYDIPYDFDLLNIDIEGSTVAAIKDLLLNSLYRPRMVILEQPLDEETYNSLAGKGYFRLCVATENEFWVLPSVPYPTTICHKKII